MGWVYEYVLQSDNHDLSQLRSIQDWYLRYELTGVSGVAEVASIGGYVKQYQVIVDPNKLAAFNIPLQKVRRAIQRSNNDVGGKLIEMGETEFMVRGLGYIKSIQDLYDIPLGVNQRGTPILLKNIATVKIGPELRRGLADFNGTGEAVGGVVIMRYGGNALETIKKVKQKLEDLKAGLPDGVRIVPVYDRSGLILRAVDNLKRTLIEESIIVTIVPILMGYFIRGKIRPEEKNPVNRFLIWIYHPVIRLVMKAKILVVVMALIILAVSYIPWSRIGSEFMPPLNEGDLLYMPTTLPGISITKAKELLQQTDRIIASFPEVHHVFGKIGRAETATDPAPLSMMETVIMLKPEDQWREGMTIKKLVAEMDRAIRFPGLTNAWTMPIKTRVDMLSTGIKTPVGIKLMGEDLQVLSDLGEKVEAALRKIPGTLSVYSERVTGGNYFDYHIRRREAARYGLTVGAVQDIIMSAVGGMNVTQTVEGLERYPVNLRYGSELRDTPEKLRRILVPTPAGAQVPITQLADIRIVKGPPAIKSENARNNAWIYVDLAGIDVGTYVQKAQRIIREEIKLPAGYSLIWSGQYEYMQRAQQRLMIVIPLTLIIIFLLLYFNFKNLTDSLIVMAAVPFSLTGGLWFMYLLGYNMSVAVGVGFIALSGVATEIGVVLLIYLDASYSRFKKKYGDRFDRRLLQQAIEEGSALRVRPIMMTAVAIMAGLMPIMWSHGTGSEIMKRIAAPMVGGMVSATFLTLVVVPALYGLVKGWRLPARADSDGKK